MSADWSSDTFRQALVAMLRRRVPEAEVDDLVQATLTEALVSRTRPEEPDALRRWIWGIARNKVVDYHRRARREQPVEPERFGDLPADSGRTPEEADDLLRWAMRELPPGTDSTETLEWLLREGEGEKLETIAEGARLPAPRVRQRVSRLRRHFRDRWTAQAATLAALGLMAVLAIVWWKRARAPEKTIAQETPHQLAPSHPGELASRERRDALDQCKSAAWQRCLDGLDRARAIDAAGDADPVVQAARREATEALTPKPAPVPAPSASPVAPAPTASFAPSPKPESKVPTAPFSTETAPPAPAPSGAPGPAKAPGKTFGKPAPRPTTDDMGTSGTK